MLFHDQTFSRAPGDACAAPCHAEPRVLTRRATSKLCSDLDSVDKRKWYKTLLVTELQQPLCSTITENTWQSEGEEEAWVMKPS